MGLRRRDVVNVNRRSIPGTFWDMQGSTVAECPEKCVRETPGPRIRHDLTSEGNPKSQAFVVGRTTPTYRAVRKVTRLRAPSQWTACVMRA